MKGLAILLVAVTLGERGLGDVLQEVVTCDEKSDGEPAARLAMQHINKHHHHGYKFKLSKLRSFRTEKEGSGCMLHMGLDLQETTCHVLNPKPFEECKVRMMFDTVKADCNVTISVAPETPTAVSYVCDTEPMDRRTLLWMCPDCPALMPLHHPDGLASIEAALAKFNREGNHTFAFKLLEVGRFVNAWILGMNRSEIAEFAIVETDCPAKGRIDPRACKSLCPDQARHGFCKSSQRKGMDVTVDCDIYEAKNSTQPSGTDPIKCRPHMGHGPAIHPPQHPWHEGHGEGHRPTRLPHYEGPGLVIRPSKPPHVSSHGLDILPPKEIPAGQEIVHPLPPHPLPGDPVPRPFPPCHGFVKIPPSIYPICPFPHIHPHLLPHLLPPQGEDRPHPIGA
ncbi:alpha-2-HS-glycoprotein 1 isoform X2 [Hypomesus transpacificus]|uniref:alpha-2-HS-glycoprotein 1 isoform X2 n=1 Tax=Hypomesus transpacificus TaxID=137520 RepID=UPI001F07939D|nr:alpha-2-HS-glycoprotein 1 isoform X2 [Hypomesus transpacificus]